MNSVPPQAAGPSRWWRVLLLLPVIGTLWVPWFAQSRPTLFGFPFFYWYLMAWVPVGAACTAIVYFTTRELI
jgi:hypothetical protein